MKYPEVIIADVIRALDPPLGTVRMVLDTDTYNEIDDQFAVIHALTSNLKVEALYAAPFSNTRSNGPEDGMEKSYEEILRLFDRMATTPDVPVYKGSRGYLEDAFMPRDSPAARDLIERANRTDEEPLYVVAIGAITNVASAILMEPAIISKIRVVWLGGNAPWWPSAREFNLMQDPHASRVILDSGVPLVLAPCQNVTSHLHTTIPELEASLRGKSSIGDYLVDIVRQYHDDHFAWSKVIWDIAGTGYLVNPSWFKTDLIHSPILTEGLTWSFDDSRHFIRSVRSIDRDSLFRDVFAKIQGA